MTSPHVEFGNIASDVGSGIGSFAKGLLAQRERGQQIALQQALQASQAKAQDANIAHIGLQDDIASRLLPGQLTQQTAQTDLTRGQTGVTAANAQTLAAQAAQREADALPADESDEGRLKLFEPHAPAGIFHNYTKGQAKDYIDKVMATKAAQARMEATQGRWENRGQYLPTPDGGYVLEHPNQGGGSSRQGSIPAPTGQPQAQGGVAQSGPQSFGTPQLPNRVQGAGKPLTSTERGVAGAAQAAASAQIDLQKFEHEHPEALDEIAKAIALPNFGKLTFGLIPGVGMSTGDVLQSFRLMGASPEAQAYLKRMFDFAGMVGPTRYGLRGMSTEHTLQQLWTDFGAGQFGLTPQGIAAANANRENAIKQMQVKAGPNAMTESQSVFGTTPQGIPAPKPANKYTGVAKP